MRQFYDTENVERECWPPLMTKIPAFRDSVVFLNGQENHRRKQYLLNAVTPKHLDLLFPKIIEDINAMIEAFKVQNGQFKSVPILYDHMIKLIFNIVVGSSPPDILAMYKTLREGEDGIPLEISFFGKPLNSFTRAVMLRPHFEAFLKQRIKDIKKDWDSSRNEPPSFLRALIQNGEYTNDEELLHDLLFIFVGGSVYTRSLQWLLYLVLNNRDVEDKIRREIDTITELNIEQLDRLTYIDDVIKETLRKGLGAVPTFFGRTKREFTVQNGSDMVKVPANQIAFVVIRNNGLSKEIFDKPEVFDPSRFSQCPMSKEVREWGFVPFGAGDAKVTHRCVGEHLTNYIFKLFVVLLWSKLDMQYVRPQDESYNWGAFTVHLEFKSGVVITVKSRDKLLREFKSKIE
jgi:cytochrome P450